MMGRNICILLDGTGNEFGQKNTNVIKLKQILKEDADEQLVYYSSGLGEWDHRMRGKKSE
jgi:uncharacterized protein (DUF2235 family)